MSLFSLAAFPFLRESLIRKPYFFESVPFVPEVYYLPIGLSFFVGACGDSDGTQTHDLQNRNLTLYSTELPSHCVTFRRQSYGNFWTYFILCLLFMVFLKFLCYFCKHLMKNV